MSGPVARTLSAMLMVLVSQLVRAQNEVPPCYDGELSAPIQAAPLASAIAAAAVPELEWWSASPQQIRDSPCRLKRPLNDIEIQKGIQDLLVQSGPEGAQKVSKNVFGIQIQNENAYSVALLEKLLRYRAPFAADGEIDSKNQKAFRSACTTVLCAVQDPKIFGPKLGPRLLYMLGRYGFNGSPYSTFNSDQFKVSEIDDVLVGLNDFPPAVLPVESNKQLTHFKRGYSMADDDSSVIANAFIFVFDKWDHLDSSQRQSTLVHEGGHYIASRYGLDNSETWLKFSGWTKRTSIQQGSEVVEFKLGSPNSTVSKYGQTNPAEDFAESVAAYRYHPTLLQMRNPEKYQFLKETVFDGLEYTSKDACNPSHALSKKLSVGGKAAGDRTENNPVAIAAAARTVTQHCGTDIFRQFTAGFSFSPGSLTSIHSCVEKSVVSSVLEKSTDLVGLKYEALARNPALDRVREVTIGASVMAQVQSQVVVQMKSAFVQYMIKVEIDRHINYNIQAYQSKSIDEFCVDYSKNSYQRFESVIGDSFGTDLYFAFSNRATLDGFAYQVCLDIHRGASKITPKNSEQIAAIVNKRFE